MAALKTFIRPDRLIEEVFASDVGYVDWRVVDSVGNVRWYEAEGFRVQGEPTNENLNTRVIKASSLETISDAWRAISLEFLAALRGLELITDQPLNFRLLYQRVEDFLRDGNAQPLTGNRGLDVLTFSAPNRSNLISEHLLSQSKKRRAGLIIFGAKRTRSNAQNFASFRVPHK